MVKFFGLFFFSIGLFSARAQSNNYDRCEIRRIEDIDQFEHWLHSKQTTSVKKQITLYQIPVVVHILHLGEPVGEGFNYSIERIESQIRTLNEDFRRREGTLGFNTHPDGGDALIEFMLAQIDPEGNPTNGIVRVDRNLVHPPPGQNDFISLSSRYSYWNPEQYLNIWCWDIGFHGIYAGKGRFPISDLNGLPTEDEDVADGDGIFINAINFGQGENTIPNLDRGRTLTHEMGHFLGLLHTYGSSGNCDEYSDYCEDTPPIGLSTNGCPSVKPIACDGRPVMIENYMDNSYDRCMNIFTKHQIARMHTVLENSPRRKSLLTSPAIITGTLYDIAHAINIYPNPVTDKLYISVDEEMKGFDIQITAHTLLGKVLFKKEITCIENTIEIPISDVREKIIILTIETPKLYSKQLIMIN
jgi:Pregnancy-associated plasma protein-A/Secretion system C-terminal sorting domain